MKRFYSVLCALWYPALPSGHSRSLSELLVAEVMHMTEKQRIFYIILSRVREKHPLWDNKRVISATIAAMKRKRR